MSITIVQTISEFMKTAHQIQKIAVNPS